SDWLIHSIKSDYGNLRKSSVFFWDGTFKVTHMYSPRTKLSVTGYSSNDSFRLLGDSTYRWRNLVGAARLDHQFASGLQGEFVLGESVYGYDLLYGEKDNATKLGFSIASTVAKAGFHYAIGKHKLNFGWQGTYYRFNPGSQEPDSRESTSAKITLDKQNSIETALYIADNLSLTERASLEAGLRLPLFTSLGPATIYQYSSERHDITTVTDTLKYRGMENIKTYVGVEPRLAFRYMTGPRSSIKAGYSRVYQFLHLVTNTTAVSPVDIWQPSGRYFKPQIADQFSLGYFVDLAENKYAISGEGFYKLIGNVVDFKDGAQLVLNRHIETELLQGKAWSYGGEFSLTKNAGTLTGSLNYTYARSFRQFNGSTPDQSISEGKVYASNYDQPHIVNFTWKLGITKRHFFTGNFTYHSGRPITIPVAAFNVDNIPVAYFSERNQYRVPDYHRLDLALVIEGTHRRKKLGDGTWVFSLYNVYARKNVYTVFFRAGADGVPKPYQLSIIGTVLPSISYNFKF
ncbi:MAG TPA: TonB-dependent receptor, partial [Cyclobacteriaceae bacterium]|nr:TonB-dependent receptor [Cyclobacteriaceae bacterium]